MKWPDINITEVFNGIMVVGALALAWISRRLGTKSAVSRSEPMQLAGAVIDRKQAETIAATVGANTEALEEHTAALHQSRRETVHAIESLDREIQNLRQKIIVSRREA